MASMGFSSPPEAALMAAAAILYLQEKKCREEGICM